MRTNLLKLLSKFLPISDVETEYAFFKTHVPSVAPEAFLNIIFKPASADVQKKVTRKLSFPASMVEFFECYNGAILFSDALRVYGCLPDHYLLNRADAFDSLPFDILRTNEEFGEELQPRGLLCVGSYGYDRSLVCMDRKTAQITCFREQDFGVIRASWPNLDQWLTSEISRMSFYFDEHGNRLVAERELPPSQDRVSSI